MKREANFTNLFRHWLKANPTAIPGSGAAFELKQTRDDSLPFDAVEEHQIEALLAVSSETGLLYKAPDDSRGYKPFDLFLLRGTWAYVVIRFPKQFSIIPIQVFVFMKEKSARKSITATEARNVGVITVDL